MNVQKPLQHFARELVTLSFAANFPQLAVAFIRVKQVNVHSPSTFIESYLDGIRNTPP